MLWNVNQALELALLGYSCRQIGEALGVNKNAVVGKFYRLRKEGKVVPRYKKPRRAAVVSKVRKIIAHRNGKVVRAKFCATPLPPVDRTNEPPSLQVGVLDLERNQCRYPHGEGSAIRFCGHPVKKGAYCEFHAKICYREEEVDVG